MTETTTPCPHCGIPVTAAERYCPSCGMPTPSDTDAAGGTAGGKPAPTQRQQTSPSGLAADPADPATPGAEAHTSGATVLDWDPGFVAKVEEAAKTAGTSFASFVQIAVAKEVALIAKANKKRVTLDQAAALLKIGHREVVGLITDGKLCARKIDGEWMIERDDLDALDSLPVNETELLARELAKLVEKAGLKGVITRGDAPESASATVCFVTRDAYLVFPQRAWKRLGPKQVITEARDAIRRYAQRRDS
jgi:hypothetical protein